MLLCLGESFNSFVISRNVLQHSCLDVLFPNLKEKGHVFFIEQLANSVTSLLDNYLFMCIKRTWSYILKKGGKKKVMRALLYSTVLYSRENKSDVSDINKSFGTANKV